MRRVFVVSCLVLTASSARAADYPKRLADEQAKLEKALAAACPKEAKRILQTRESAPKKVRCDALTALAKCGRADELYHLKTGAACFAVQDFNAAEHSYRAALAVRVTEAAQVALLTALVRQKARVPKQNADIDKHLTYFESRPCSRDDLCAGLTYVTWHLGKDALTVKNATRAIALGFPGWQPYFFGATVLSSGTDAQRAQAKRWLVEAKRRGGPSAIDTLLEDLERRATR